MYRYAISFPDRCVTDPAWQNAIATSPIPRIEFSCAGCFCDGRELRRRVTALAALQQQRKVEVASIHVPFGCYWNIAQLDDYGRRRAVALTEEFLEITSPLNCRNYTLHPSAEPIAIEDRTAAMAQSRRSLRELAPVAKTRGLSFNVEDLPRTCLGRDEAELRELLQDLPEENFGYCLDVNHFCNAPESCPAVIARLGRRIRTMHLSDYDGIDECHWYPGLGVLDWSAVMAEIRRLPGDVLLIQETFGFLKAPGQNPRQIDPKIVCANAAKSLYYLEHAEEIAAGLRILAAREKL